MTAKKASFKVKNSDGKYEVVHFKTSANQIETNNEKQFISKTQINQIEINKKSIDTINKSIYKKTFKTVDEMVSSDFLKEGDYVITLGYYNVNDGGQATYRIVNSTSKDDYGSSFTLANGLKAKIQIDNSVISIKQFGVKSGTNVDIESNTMRFQKAIDFITNDKVLYFPAEVFLLGQVSLGDKKNITLRGLSSSFGSSINKSIYANAQIKDSYTQIICMAPEQEPMFLHSECIIILENMSFYNTRTINNVNYGTGFKKNALVGYTGANTTKGKVFTTGCHFNGFKVVFGDSYTFDHLETSLSTGLKQPENLKQCCVLASRCRFTDNGIGINQSVDGRIIDCSFNKNDYGIVLRENSGFTTITNCRIEWNNCNGIYVDKAHDVTLSNIEYDRNGYSGLYINNSSNCNIDGSVFRRNGANTELLDTDTKNNHIVFTNNKNCNCIGINTVVKVINDTGSPDGTPLPKKPYNCSIFKNNTDCIIAFNNLKGCVNQTESANIFLGNASTSIVKDNLKY